MKKLMKSVAVILGLSVLTATANANLPSRIPEKIIERQPGETCYLFNAKGFGEWQEWVLLSKKQLTPKAAHAYMQKNHGMSDVYDLEIEKGVDCESLVVGFMSMQDYVVRYKEEKPKSKTTSAVKNAK